MRCNFSQLHFLKGLQYTAVTVSIVAAIMAYLDISKWRYRNRREIVDGDSLQRWLLFATAHFSTLMGLGVAAYGIYWVLVYTGQSEIRVVPLVAGEQREYLQLFLPIVCWFKFVHVCYIVYSQCTIDIFFVDWERSRHETTVDTREKELDAESGSVR